MNKEWNCFSCFPIPLLISRANFWLCTCKPSWDFHIFDWSSMILGITCMETEKVMCVTPNFCSWIVELLEYDYFTYVPVLEVRAAFQSSWGFLTGWTPGYRPLQKALCHPPIHPRLFCGIKHKSAKPRL